MKNLKIFLALLLALTMVVSMAACGDASAGKDTKPAGTKAPAADDDAADDTTEAAPDDSKDLSWLNLGGVAANKLADKYTGTGVLSWVELDRETRAKQMQALPPVGSDSRPQRYAPKRNRAAPTCSNGY